jgi:type II secretory pathway predicted ATPase ExeA
MESKQVYIQTRAAQVAIKALDRIVEQQILGVIVGAPGSGKNESLRRWKRTTRARYVIVEATIRNTPLPLLRALSVGLDLEPIRTHMAVDRLCEGIADRLTDDPVAVLINEADMLTLPAFERLRGIWDMVSERRGLDGEHAFPLAFLGTDKLTEMLCRPDLERLHRRVIEFHRLPTLSLEETKFALGAKWPDLKYDDDGLAAIHRLSRGSFGWLNVIVPKAAELAQKDGKIVNAAIMRVVPKYLIGVE